MEFPEPDELQAVIHQHVSRFRVSGCCFEEISGYAREKFSLKAKRRDPSFAERVWGAICVLMYQEKIKQTLEDDIVRYHCV